MSAAEMPAGAAPEPTPDWHSIDWRKVWSTVRRLQARIVKAVAEGRWNKVKADVADRTSPVIGGSIFLKRRVRPENGGNRLDEPQVRPRTSPTTQEWGRKAAQSAQIRSL